MLPVKPNNSFDVTVTTINDVEIVHSSEHQGEQPDILCHEREYDRGLEQKWRLGILGNKRRSSKMDNEVKMCWPQMSSLWTAVELATDDDGLIGNLKIRLNAGRSIKDSRHEFFLSCIYKYSRTVSPRLLLK